MKRPLIERTKTAIPGLDKLFNGGIPKGNLVVLAGDPGSGKTIFSIQFLYNGITKFNEPGIYISLEETADNIIKTGNLFGWNLEKQINDGMLKIYTIELYDFDKLKNTIEDLITTLGAKRIVIDPGVVFRLFFEREIEARKRILSLGIMLKKMGCTSIITNEISLDKQQSLFGLEEYVADGVILLFHTRLASKYVRSIGILKMRGTEITEKIHPVKIASEGIVVQGPKNLFEDL
ncbi:MAG: gas vesicle protein GvpD [Candidatus Diapherotrites archaeon]|nr:gas vesicle protein GvpD [Candidatus Diapherotrites archaeon]